MGSSLKFLLVAEGAAHIYPRLAPTMEVRPLGWGGSGGQGAGARMEVRMQVAARCHRCGVNQAKGTLARQGST